MFSQKLVCAKTRIYMYRSFVTYYKHAKFILSIRNLQRLEVGVGDLAEGSSEIGYRNLLLNNVIASNNVVPNRFLATAGIYFVVPFKMISTSANKGMKQAPKIA